MPMAAVSRSEDESVSPGPMTTPSRTFRGKETRQEETHAKTDQCKQKGRDDSDRKNGKNMGKGGESDGPDRPAQDTGETAKDQCEYAQKKHNGEERGKTLLLPSGRVAVGDELTPHPVRQSGDAGQKPSVKIPLLKSRFDDLVNDSARHQIGELALQAPANLYPDLPVLFRDNEEGPVILPPMPDLPCLSHSDRERFDRLTLEWTSSTLDQRVAGKLDATGIVAILHDVPGTFELVPGDGGGSRLTLEEQHIQPLVHLGPLIRSWRRVICAGR